MITPMEGSSHSHSAPVAAFDEVAVYFSEEEWGSLRTEQKEIYKNVMMENFRSLRSLGLLPVKPDIISMIEEGREPWITGANRTNARGGFLHSPSDPSAEQRVTPQRYTRAQKSLQAPKPECGKGFSASA
ncbi:zinc finger protein 324B-like, partial [Mantella aurantiaca]